MLTWRNKTFNLKIVPYKKAQDASETNNWLAWISKKICGITQFKGHAQILVIFI